MLTNITVLIMISNLSLAMNAFLSENVQPNTLTHMLTEIFSCFIFRSVFLYGNQFQFDSFVLYDT